MDTRVIVITTGGTIAMKFDPRCGAVVPAVSGSDLVEAVPGLDAAGAIEVCEFSNIPSPHMTPELMFKLGQVVMDKLAEATVAGVVITHGTDTIEETAYFLDLVVNSPKPVCLTAAMRSGEEISPDGPKNILCAVRAAFATETRGLGVLVVMNEEIHAAREVTKTHSANPATFASPCWGPLGYVDEDRVIVRRTPVGRQHIAPKRLTAKVDLVKLMTGSDAAYVDFALSRKVSGLVLEAFGRGNMPPAVVPGIERAVSQGIPVVLTTRTSGGRVLDVYGYPGGVKNTMQVGAIAGGEISAAKARLKLMLILSLDPRPALAAVADYFDEKTK